MHAGISWFCIVSAAAGTRLPALPLMPTRREIPRLKLEDAATNAYDEHFPQGSDDELDEAARAVKRRRIEALGESYLRGRPLFISSALLRGPFDGGWVNPWRKHRKHHEIEHASARPGIRLAQDVIPETDKSTKDNAGGTSIRSGNRDSPQYSTSPRSRSNSYSIRQSSTAREVGRSASDVRPVQNWLKREKKSINIENYDPPKSPSSRYASLSATAKHPKGSILKVKAEPTFARAIKPHQTDLRNVRRDKSVSSNSQEKSLRAWTNGSSPFSYESTSYESGDQNCRPPSKTERIMKPKNATSGRFSKNLAKNDDAVSPMAELLRPEITMPASTSSIHVIPPSSHLSEFKYRLAKSQSNKGSEEQREQHSLKTERTASLECLPEDLKNETELTSSRLVLPSDHQDQASAPVRTSTATLCSISHENETSTESEKIPSAQIVPKHPGTSDCFISLHSTEICGLAAEKGMTSIDGELSTQAAFELAQKSFQDDLATPQRDFQSTTKRKGQSSIKRITPFANINASDSMINIKIEPKNTPGTTHNINTQAMIDAITPFSEVASPNPTTSGTGRKSVPKADAINSQTKKTISFASSPRPSSRSISLDRSSSFKEAQNSGHDSLPPLPLTLSGTTPATNQQDGQGFLFSVDAFDVSQVIQDAGSWLQQSYDIGKEMKKRGIRSSGKDTQSSPPSSRCELSLV